MLEASCRPDDLGFRNWRSSCPSAFQIILAAFPEGLSLSLQLVGLWSAVGKRLACMMHEALEFLPEGPRRANDGFRACLRNAATWLLNGCMGISLAIARSPHRRAPSRSAKLKQIV